ncbi:hypothetical protein Pan189_03090 [Stratiformator vulcanicus]|uniref:Uncharacterized protein n=1 Tax=Stratiformator vulcanicus TaxID=2527980 RepID=A0A517QWH4_9PLAN|nr:hypothetical protein [Stratiformator vulcanicus]QDT35954.1 hypothetical protein Pan189_03090 [Stratiformator vulcanicus]
MLGLLRLPWTNNPPLPLDDNFAQRLFDDMAICPELYDIEPSLTALERTDFGLRDLERIGQIDLRQSGCLSAVAEQP